MRQCDRPFAGTNKITDIHGAFCAEACNATWASEFIPAPDRPHMRFLLALLWVFHSAGMCCAVVGENATYMAGVFPNSYDIAIYVAYTLLINSDIANTILCVTTQLSNIRCFSFLTHDCTCFLPGPVSRIHCAQG
jgi:hypothetical protein